MFSLKFHRIRPNWYLIHMIGLGNGLLPESDEPLYEPKVTKTTMDSSKAELITHYIDVIMTTLASQITSLTVVYSIVYSGTDQRKHQSSESLAFARGIHRDRWIPRTKGQ